MNSSTATTCGSRCLPNPTRVNAIVFRTLLILAVLKLVYLVDPAALAESRQDRTASLQNAKESFLLSPGKPLERKIQGVETHFYRIDLSPDQYVRIVVNQRGIDVVIALSDPDGQPLMEVDGPFGSKGAEIISMVAGKQGIHLLEVRSLIKTAPAGRYEVSVKELRASTPLDSSRIAAERIEKQAQDLLQKETRASRQLTVERYGEALALYQTVGDQEGEARCLLVIGLMNRMLGKSTEALESFDKARSLARSTGDRSLEANILRESAKIFHSRKDRQKTLEYYSEAVSIAAAAGDHSEEAFGLNDIGWVHKASAEHQEALRYFLRAIDVSRGSGDQLMEGTSLNNAALTYQDISENQKALDCFLQALPLKRNVGHKQGEGSILNNIGSIYQQLGEPQKALDYYKQALVLWRGLDNGRFEAIALHGIGSAYLALGDYATSLEHLTRALQLARTSSDRATEATTLLALSKLHFNRREYEKALEHSNAAREICRNIGNIQREASALNHIAWTSYRLGNNDKALELLSQVVSMADSVGDLRQKADALNGMAHVHNEKGDYAQARAHIESALNIIESIRGKISSRDMRISYFASTRQYYSFYIDLLMKLHQLRPTEGHDRVALQINERALARNLMEALSESYSELRRGVDPALLERERVLKQQLNARSDEQIRLLAGKHTDQQAAAAAWEIGELITELQSVQGQIRVRSPRYAALTQPVSLTLDQIQEQVLDSDTLLLEYALGERKCYLWAITRTSMTSFELGSPSEVQSKAREVYRLLTERNRRIRFETVEERRTRLVEADAEYNKTAAALSQILLQPLTSHRQKKRVVIVADGALQYIPFAALPDPAAPSEPLITKREVMNLPSASTLGLIRHETAGRKPAPKRIAILADPVYDTRDLRNQARLSEEMVSINRVGERGTGSSSDAGLSFTDLPPASSQTGTTNTTLRFPRLTFTRREADAIAALADPKDIMLALDFNASRATAIGPRLAEYRIVHLAAHGLLDTQAPDRSAIVLSLVDEQGSPQNGFLRLHDIYDLNLPAELVVLSACQTALGKLTNGEGLVGLTRAFMYAGSKRVVASLWKVGDHATAELMHTFYKAMLKDGQSAAAGLRTAQMALRKQPRWRAPFFWASFTLHGEYY